MPPAICSRLPSHGQMAVPSLSKKCVISAPPGLPIISAMATASPSSSKDEGFFQVDLFTDTTKLEKEKKLQNAMLGLKKKFGKNAVLKGTNYLDGATMRERNQQIGGHKAT